ncbi:hypothetical protein [Bradyrhizobium cajani]|uniref:Uncharacterized protein n=1 Tax=Bradyrhizobium cajani TaxID=1928661 RepID=A0A844TGP8_9BRAD|nr:hypothetical protein [Bradyrhizobium cajani]MCP3372778.1 hypothetical protein [Bradyrhizobium cajani]MVT78223.1 hypothetical protein [Bradyrhizobium cajani]
MRAVAGLGASLNPRVSGRNSVAVPRIEEGSRLLHVRYELPVLLGLTEFRMVNPTVDGALILLEKGGYLGIRGAETAKLRGLVCKLRFVIGGTAGFLPRIIMRTVEG